MNLTAVAATEFAPAKLNLALHVTGQRADGYHLIESLVVFAGIGDLLTITPSPVDSFSVEGRFAAAVPVDATNLAIRARDLLRRFAHKECAKHAKVGSVSIALDKNLPVASGIGGGSSDAAATLRCLNKLWKLDLATTTLADLGKPLGADVPMCVAAQPLIARGIGEITTPLASFPSMALVLVNCGVAVETPTVFKALASRANPPLPALPVRPDFGALLEWLRITRNDLEVPAQTIAPPIGEALAVLRGRGAALVRMSGSGATCFGLYERLQDAEAAAGAIRQERPDWFVAATQTFAATGENDAGN